MLRCTHVPCLTCSHAQTPTDVSSCSMELPSCCCHSEAISLAALLSWAGCPCLAGQMCSAAPLQAFPVPFPWGWCAARCEGMVSLHPEHTAPFQRVHSSQGLLVLELGQTGLFKMPDSGWCLGPVVDLEHSRQLSHMVAKFNLNRVFCYVFTCTHNCVLFQWCSLL